MQEQIKKPETQIKEESGSSTPWKPAATLDIPKLVVDKYPGHHFAWVSQSDISIRQNERYTYVELSEADQKTLTPWTIIDGKPMGTHYKIRELTLMKITNADYASRQEYFDKLTKAQQRSNVERFKGATEIPGHGNVAEGKIQGKVEIGEDT